MRCDGKFTVGDLFVALFLIVLSPITWIVIGILELLVYWNYMKEDSLKKLFGNEIKNNKLCG